jgi:hypothetical protein
LYEQSIFCKSIPSALLLNSEHWILLSIEPNQWYFFDTR